MSTDPGKALHTVLERIRIAPSQATGSLMIWPLVCEVLAPRLGGTRITTLAQALEDGFVSVDEQGVSREGAGGSVVREVRIGNRASDPVLIIFSEELHVESGALIAEASVLLPPTSELEIGVHPAGLREAGLREAGSREAGPREAGSRDEAADSRAGSAGETSEVGEFRKGFPLVERQVGFIAAIGGEIVGLEVMADAEIFARSFETLLRPFVLDAQDENVARESADEALEPLFVSPEPFLAALEASHAVAGPTAGLGRGLRVAGPGLVGCALEAGEIVHLTAYPLEVAWAA